MAAEIAPVKDVAAITAVNPADKPAKVPKPPSLINQVNHLANGFDYALTHPFSTVINDLRGMLGILTGNGAAVNASANRVMGWVQSTPIASLKSWVLNQLAKLRAELNSSIANVIGLIFDLERVLDRKINLGLRSERHYRLLGDAASERYARLQVMALHSQIEREAVSGYRQGFSDRLSLIARVADYAANHSPWVSALIRDLITGTLDLASVDNPLARLLLGFIAKQVLQRLTTDRAVGTFIADLLGPLTGEPRPRDLAGVIGDISARLGAGEQQWAQFYQDGGAEILQAGREWRNITGPLADVALIAWLGQAATDPEGWAREVSDVLNPVLSAAQHGFTALIKGVK